MERSSKECPRCHRDFVPHPAAEYKGDTKFCDACRYRNLMDGLGLPTPPAMVDPYTRRPTLTQAEYLRLMAKRGKKKRER